MVPQIILCNKFYLTLTDCALCFAEGITKKANFPMRSTMRSRLMSGSTRCTEELAQQTLIQWENLMFPVAHDITYEGRVIECG